MLKTTTLRVRENLKRRFVFSAMVDPAAAIDGGGGTGVKTTASPDGGGIEGM